MQLSEGGLSEKIGAKMLQYAFSDGYVRGETEGSGRREML